jgi:hypothetical protein
MAEKPATSSNQSYQQQRRLSFIDSESQANSDHDALMKKRQSQVGTLNSSVNPGERRQSIWNIPRKSLYQRRMSYSLSQGSRKSSQDLGPGYPRIRLQNTYRTEPNSEQEKFKPYKLEPKLYAALEEALKDRKYDQNKTSALTKELSQIIMRETRLLMNNSSPRYKLVSHVLIGEMKNQDIRHGSRCLWDNNLDNLVSVVYKNNSLFAVATIFAVYYE